MKKVVLFFLIHLPMLVGAQDFGSVLDFSVELSTLVDRDRTMEIVDAGRIVILEGVSGDTMMMKGGPVLRILGGEWIGSEEVRAYTCLFYLDDRIWGDVFPAGRPDMPGPDYVAPGSRLLVAARVTGWDDDAGEPVAEILDYRVLK